MINFFFLVFCKKNRKFSNFFSGRKNELFFVLKFDLFYFRFWRFFDFSISFSARFRAFDQFGQSSPSFCDFHRIFGRSSGATEAPSAGRPSLYLQRNVGDPPDFAADFYRQFIIQIVQNSLQYFNYLGPQKKFLVPYWIFLL